MACLSTSITTDLFPLSSTIIASPLQILKVAPSFMLTETFADAIFIAIGMCLEEFLYGKISVVCAFKLSCIIVKGVQLITVLGFYSGIFAIYLQGPSKESRTASIVFYVLRLLYLLSTVTLVCDILNSMVLFYLPVSNISNLKNIVFISYTIWCASGLSERSRFAKSKSWEN